MPDFTSALYLGLRHPSDTLGRWAQLTTGAPAALREPLVARRVASEAAALLGCQRGVVFPSTLHLAWDVMGWLARRPVAVYVDAAAYAILWWGAERALARGLPVSSVPAHDAAALRLLLKAGGAGRRPVILTDGYCPACGRVAPLREYLALAREFAGLLVVDDTQAIGVLGRTPNARHPYGVEGGGSLRWLGVEGPEVLTIASLAKGLGVPVAVCCGPAALLDPFVEQSETRVHCSPPSVAVLNAAVRAFEVNRKVGDRLRASLLERVRRFRERLRADGVRPSDTLFPVQSLDAGDLARTRRVHGGLARQGVHAVLARRHPPGSAAITFLLTARHTAAAIDRAARVTAAALQSVSPTTRPGGEACHRLGASHPA